MWLDSPNDYRALVLDVQGSRELQAVVLSLQAADRQVRKDINAAARARLRPIWAEALRGNVRDRLDARVILPGASIAVGVRNVKATAAKSSKPLRGGLVPTRDWPGVELGASPGRAEFKQRSRKGTIYERTMTTNRQFRRRRVRGAVAFDAAGELGVKLVGIWVRTIVETFQLAAEGNR